MAIYRCEVRIHSRKNRGKSVVASAAYRAAATLHGAREDVTYDYSRRRKGVLEATILAPENAPSWATDLGQLWNRAEASERRKDAQLAREFILALPKELSTEQQSQLVKDWVRVELISQGMTAQISLHIDRKGVNPHAHVLATLRRFEGEKFAPKKAREWNGKEVLAGQRKSWADAVNIALERAGVTDRVDHRSLKDRGIDQIPQPKIGVAATAMEKRGVIKDSRRRQEVRFTAVLNAALPFLRKLERGESAKQEHYDPSWLDRSIAFIGRAKDAVRHGVTDMWNRLRGEAAPEPAGTPARGTVLDHWNNMRSRMAFPSRPTRPEPAQPAPTGPEITR